MYINSSVSVSQTLGPMTGEQATVSQVMWVLGPEFSLLEEQEVLLASQLTL